MKRVAAIAAMAVLVSSQAVLSQAWRDAVMIMASGDSIRGQIEFADPDVSISRFQFRSNTTAAPVIYDQEQVNSFTLVDPPQRFERLDVQVTYYSIGVVPYGENPVRERANIKAFAEVISASPSISLYSLYDADRKERFFVRKGKELAELRKITYQVERNSSLFRVMETPYKGQLRSLLADCLEINAKSLNYDRRSLGKAVDSYIACKGEASVAAPDPSALRLLNVGGFVLVGTGSTGGLDTGWGGTFGVSTQILSRKNRGNQFLWIDVGVGNPDILTMPIHFGVMAGSYFGQGRVQPLINVGVTTLVGTFSGGLGVGYKKRIVLTGNVNAGIFTDQGLLYTVKLGIYPRIRRK
jgi:hypothetical protein